MDKIKVTGIRLYDGEYDFDPTYFTNKELHTIKRMAGVRGGEIGEAFAAGDTDLIVAFAAIALERGGKIVNEDILWNAKVGAIELIPDTSDKGDDADPPTTGSEEKPSEKSDSSGSTLSEPSDPQENGQSPTGPPILERSSA